MTLSVMSADTLRRCQRELDGLHTPKASVRGLAQMTNGGTTTSMPAATRPEAGGEPVGEEHVLTGGLHIAQGPQQDAVVVRGRPAAEPVRGRCRLDRHIDDVERRQQGARACRIRSIAIPSSASAQASSRTSSNPARAARSRVSAVARSAMSSGSSVSAARIARPSLPRLTADLVERAAGDPEEHAGQARHQGDEHRQPPQRPVRP